MSDKPIYEYIARATAGDGQVLSESRPRPHTLSWAPGLGAAMLRRRHPDVTVAQLRRLAGSSGEWEPLTREQVAEAHLGSLAGVLAASAGFRGLGEAFAALKPAEPGRETP